MTFDEFWRFLRTSEPVSIAYRYAHRRSQRKRRQRQRRGQK